MTKYLLLSLLLLSNIANAKFDYFLYRDAEGKIHNVEPCFVDKEIRNIPTDKVQWAMNHMFIYAVKMDDGNYALHAFVKGLGGGPGGATVGFLGGKAVTHIVCHGGIALVSWGIGFFFPPAGAAIHTGLEAVLAAPIEGLSNVVGCGTGLLLGTVTGPA